ncbi:MAG: patatin-like phospholipase family protein [Defluviitaleaceae bacterium]|nr:patatin-like phospholipase family protein [Defluviitaleaceae bacterium]
MMRIGLALSGGGIRAAVFHLGVLRYMADSGLFSRISSISSVSGASLCMGVIFAANGNKWPSAEAFIKDIQPRVKRLIINEDIQRSALLRLPFSPTKWNNRVELLADMLEEKWGVVGNLQDLPSFPFWEINCTTFETGNRFRFRKDYMGDQKIGYVQNPNLPISHLIAASAAYPVLIGPYTLKTTDLRFTADKQGKGKNAEVLDRYTLWDGGVFDNLGLDALHKIGGHLDREINFLIVSDASLPLEHQNRGRPSQNLRRLLDIATNQANHLRARDFIYSIVGWKRGLYVKIGEGVRNYPTTLNAPSEKDFDLIFNNGYESAKHEHVTKTRFINTIK